MDLPFLIVGGHIFWDSELAATEIERWVAYITFISEIILTISKAWIISINHHRGDIWFFIGDICNICICSPPLYIVVPPI